MYNTDEKVTWLHVICQVLQAADVQNTIIILLFDCGRKLKHLIISNLFSLKL